MNSLLTLAKDLEQKSKAQQQSTGEMLKAAFRGPLGKRKFSYVKRFELNE